MRTLLLLYFLFIGLATNYANTAKFSDSIYSQNHEIELYNDADIADTLSVFTEFWNNDQLFSYTYPVSADVKDSVLIYLVDDFRGYEMPYKERIISNFGWRGNRPHNGLDIHLETGDSVVSAFDGKVRYAQFNKGGYGNLVIIRHFNGLETYYGHLSKIDVLPNQMVKAGDYIGKGGSTGHSKRPHLHFETRYMDKPFNPLLLFSFDSMTLATDSIVLTKNSFKKTGSSSVSTTNRTTTSNQVVSKVNNTINDGVYIVKKGDTLYRIALSNNTTVEKLCSYNNISSDCILQIGQKIKVN